MSIRLKLGDCVEVLRTAPDNYVDLTVTSPPYDDLRTYKGAWSFDFEGLAHELYRVTKPGGIVVWVVNDATHNGSETGTSFRQALFFKSLGFNLHDTMIWNKGGFSAVGALKTRYAPVFEYMFILSKGDIRTFNPIKDRPNKWAGTKVHGTIRQVDGTTKPVSNNREIQDFGQRHNIWEIPPHRQRGDNTHPAPFPLQLALDHVMSWSNPGDLVLDPFMGSGTTGVAARQLGRRFVGIEIAEEYFSAAHERINTDAA